MTTITETTAVETTAVQTTAVEIAHAMQRLLGLDVSVHDHNCWSSTLRRGMCSLDTNPEIWTLAKFLRHFTAYPKMMLARQAISANANVNDGASSYITFMVVYLVGLDPRYRFIAFKSPREAVSFFEKWVHMQKNEIPLRHSTLMECSSPYQKRKWILDLDGDLESLKKFGFLTDGATCTDADKEHFEQLCISLGVQYSRAIHSLKFTERPCNFAIKTRHRLDPTTGLYTKLSAHITLLILAPYDMFRNIMLQIQESLVPQWVKDAKASGGQPSATPRDDTTWQMELLSDDHIIRNKCGQNIQTLYSRKVQPLDMPVPHIPEAPGFQFFGLFDSNGHPITEGPQSIMGEFMATSFGIPDPWSITSICTCEKIDRGVSNKRAISVTTAVASSEAEASAEAKRQTNSHHIHMQEWMRPLLGTSIISNADKLLHMPNIVLQAIQEQSGGEVVFNIRVQKTPLCWRRLANNNEVSQHRNNRNGLALCVRTSPSSYRLFVRCFSVSCMQPPTTATWIEMLPKHAELVVSTTQDNKT